MLRRKGGETLQPTTYNQNCCRIFSWIAVTAQNTSIPFFFQQRNVSSLSDLIRIKLLCRFVLIDLPLSSSDKPPRHAQTEPAAVKHDAYCQSHVEIHLMRVWVHGLKHEGWLHQDFLCNRVMKFCLCSEFRPFGPPSSYRPTTNRNWQDCDKLMFPLWADAARSQCYNHVGMASAKHTTYSVALWYTALPSSDSVICRSKILNSLEKSIFYLYFHFF